jgi:hypothetical protein
MNLELSHSIMDERLSKGTRRNYGSKMKQFIIWLKENHLEYYNEEDESVILPLPTLVMQEFFGHVIKKRDKNNGDNIPDKWNAYQTVSGFKSTLKDLYRDNKIAFGTEAENMCAEFFQGYQRKIAGLKQSGAMSLVEGKRPLSFAGYKYLAQKSTKQGTDLNLAMFAHTFLLLCWNLIARSISVGNLMYCHISWELDSLVAYSNS